MLNEASLIGNLGQDPEIRAMQSGKQLAQLSVATSEKYKKDGEWTTKTEWHRVVVFNEPTVKYLEQYASKGSTVFIRGKIQTRKWEDKEGNTKYTTEIVVGGYNGEVKLIGGHKRKEAEEPEEAEQDELADDEVPF